MTIAIFKEEQKYMQGRVLYLLIPVWTIILVGIGVAYYNQTTKQENSELNLMITFFIILALALVQTIIFSRLKLITEIRNDGIYFKYPPVITRWKHIPLANIESCEIRQFKPHREYGGHGINVRRHRLRRRKWGISYAAFGNTGLQLILKKGKKTLIGTQRAQALKYTLDKMNYPVEKQN